jgi:hypothetical protein
MSAVRPRLVAALLLFALPISAVRAQQQFVEQPLQIPGPILWSETALPLDANGDGLLDVLFLNASGYQFPGDLNGDPTPKPPTLVLGTGIVEGVPTFADATSQYFPPSFEIHGKHVAMFDVNGDGDDDLVFAAAFGDQQRIFIKDTPNDRYVDQTFRLPVLILNAFNVGWGDFDDDGDIDLVFPDAGPDAFNPPGGLARLLLNDGAGVYAEAPFPAVLKVGAQNAKVVDIDGDLDLDVIIDGKSPVMQLYLNDGAANFTLDLTTIPPTDASSFGTYESEWADLDGDSDIDGLLINSGPIFESGGVQNLLADTSSLSMSLDNTVFHGSNDDDENDYVYLDSDDDGDLDVLVGTLQIGPTPEKLFVNTGTFGPGFLVQQALAFTESLDATLDLGVADFDGDGAYDVVSAQGEFPVLTGFRNRYYKNIGAPDTTAPGLLAASMLPSLVTIDDVTGDGLVLRAGIQDSIVDDGITYVQATLEWDVAKGASTDPDTAPMPHVGGNVHRGELVAQPTAEGLVGAQIDVSVQATDPVGNTVSLPLGSTVVCGSESYGAGTGLVLVPPPPAGPGDLLSFIVQGPSLAPGALLFSLGQDVIPYAGGSILVSLPTVVEPFFFAIGGSGSVLLPLPLPANPIFEGLTFYSQAVISQSGAKTLSAGVETVICEME